MQLLLIPSMQVYIICLSFHTKVVCTLHAPTFRSLHVRHVFLYFPCTTNGFYIVCVNTHKAHWVHAYVIDTNLTLYLPLPLWEFHSTLMLPTLLMYAYAAGIHKLHCTLT